MSTRKDAAPKAIVEEKKMRRIGFGDGQSKIPDDIKTIFKDEIEEMFYGKPDKLKI